MPTQNIDFSAVASATFDGTDLSEIKLNGTSIWSAVTSPFADLPAGFTVQYDSYESGFASFKAHILDLNGANTIMWYNSTNPVGILPDGINLDSTDPYQDSNGETVGTADRWIMPLSNPSIIGMHGSADYIYLMGGSYDTAYPRVGNSATATQIRAARHAGNATTFIDTVVNDLTPVTFRWDNDQGGLIEIVTNGMGLYNGYTWYHFATIVSYEVDTVSSWIKTNRHIRFSTKT